MDLFLNEKSLDGQFATVTEFSEQGIEGLIAVLEDLKRLSIPITLYKSEHIINAKVTPTQTYLEILFDNESRIHDGIRRYKSQLANLLNEPYWNGDSHQKEVDYYKTRQGQPLNGSSVAEAESRNGILASFPHPDYSDTEISIYKNNKIVLVNNVCRAGHLIDAVYRKKYIKFKEYAVLKFEGQKLDFSKAEDENVWDVIPIDYEKQLYDTFAAFCKTSWFDIPKNKGLGYKSYNKNRKNSRFFTAEQWTKGIKEFRFSGKYRCFGFAEGDKFFLLMIHLEHKLGDL